LILEVCVLKDKFYVDAMLGKFGKMLRILGFDTLIAPPNLTDTEILNQCLLENRFLITYDRLFHSRLSSKKLADGRDAKSLFLDKSDQVEQLTEFFHFFDINPEFLDLNDPNPSFVSRCTSCNGSLSEISKEEAKEKLQTGTFNSHEKFWCCNDCQQIYWIGSHWNNIKVILLKVFENF
jgi:hypothetical protein